MDEPFVVEAAVDGEPLVVVGCEVSSVLLVSYLKSVRWSTRGLCVDSLSPSIHLPLLRSSSEITGENKYSPQLRSGSRDVRSILCVGS